MKRMIVIAALVALAQTIAAFSGPEPQAPTTTTTLRRIQVNARTIKELAPGKNYVVDLTHRGLKYEFDPRAGQIDFNRVRVRTAQGEMAIGSFLGTKFLTGRLAGFKYPSKAFVLATRPPGIRPTHSTSNLIHCDELSCYCFGTADCLKLLFDTICCEDFFCREYDQGTNLQCHCSRPRNC